MVHFGTDVSTSRTTPTPWLRVGAQIGSLVNEWADRDDLVVYVGSEAAVDHGAPALFNPASAEIEVNSAIAFGSVRPEHLGDMNLRPTQFEFPAASGAILHEAMHARFSTWNIAQAVSDLSREEYQALSLLEESRIECRGVNILPENRSFLRSCALDIVLGDMTEESIASQTQVRQVAHLLGLTYARVDAGVLDEADVDPMRALIAVTLPTETVDALRAVWREFQSLSAVDIERMYELAREWVRIVSETSVEAGEDQPGDGGEGGGGDMSDIARAIAEMLDEAAGNTAVDAQDEAYTQQTKEEYQERAKTSKSSAEERSKHQKMSSRAMGTGSVESGSRSRLIERRKANADERISAVKISKALERARYRDRIRIESNSVIPPGRVRSRALVQGEAYREQNVAVQTEPFQRVQRKHVDDPNLVVGVMVDISGSMGDAMQPMASAAWIMSEAVKRAQGVVAMTYFGSGVFPTLKPGESLKEVQVYDAADGTEKFDEAFKITDGALNLLHGSGARLLVIVSDGHYVNDESRAAKSWIKRCSAAGVAVLWIGAGGYGAHGETYVARIPGASYVRMGRSATDAANAIGQAAEKALTAAGTRM